MSEKPQPQSEALDTNQAFRIIEDNYADFVRDDNGSLEPYTLLEVSGSDLKSFDPDQILVAYGDRGHVSVFGTTLAPNMAKLATQDWEQVDFKTDADEVPADYELKRSIHFLPPGGVDGFTLSERLVYRDNKHTATIFDIQKIRS